MTIDPRLPQRASAARNSVRASLIFSAVVGIVLGLLLIFLPRLTLLTVALLFGIAIIVAGVDRIAYAVASRARPGRRLFLGGVGVLAVIAGILCLLHPGSTLLFLVIVIGIGWILEGIHDLAAGILGTQAGPRWVPFVVGPISIIAGIVVFTLPGLALATFVTVGGILLLIVSVATLFMLPRKVETGAGAGAVGPGSPSPDADRAGPLDSPA